MDATRELVRVAEQALGCPVAAPKGIFRPAITEQQRADFDVRAANDPSAVWKEISLPGMPPTQGLWIESGMTIYSRLYLQGLWLACEKRGAKLVKTRVQNLSQLEDFDQVVLATGFETSTFDNSFPLKATLGQTLLCRWKEPLPFSLVSQGHITPTEDPALCQVGSTYEHTSEPDPQLARQLLEKAALFYPPALNFEILEVRTGVRVTQREGYRPLVAKIAPKVWVFTGLGSRGMLYHAWLGASLAEGLISREERLIIMPI